MYKSRLHKCIKLACILVVMFLLGACSQPKEVAKEEPQGGFVKIAPGAYDSADTAVVIAKQEKLNKITFLNLKKKLNYTLNYDGTTKFTDKYGSAIAVSQLEEGEIVDLQFLKDEKLLASVTVSSEVWTYDQVSKFELDMSAGRMKLFNEYYTLEESTVVLSDGKPVEFLDIHAQDVLKIKGKDHKIYSISIENGHGYLRLDNAEYFIGGWIEIGKTIQKIQEETLLTVPEGKYNVYVSHSGIEGTKEVEILRGQETLLDIGDLKKDDMVKYGNLIFTVDPSTAEVRIDGKVVDTSRIVKATYGLHQIMAKADGYDTVIQYIRVTGNSANVAITLDEEKDRSVSANSTEAVTITNTDTSNNTSDSKENQSSSDKSDASKDTSTEKKAEISSQSSDNTVSGSSTSAGSASTGYKVTIESPVGAEIYVDGNYVGIVPASFTKVAGSHEVTVRKSGYLTRSYTIDVDKEEKDVSYSFSDLTPIE